MSNNALMIFAHPDDEVLACGGTIAKLRQSGQNVTVVFVADGESSRTISENDANYQKLIAQRKRNCLRALSVLGVDATSVHFLDYPDNKLDTIATLIIAKEISNFIQKVQPNLIITHSAGDLNVDHRVTSEAVIIAARPSSYPHPLTILEGEVCSSTEWRQYSRFQPFIPNYFYDITAYLELKLKALMLYHNEIPQFPHARSIEAVQALAKLRGASVHVKAAEAFYMHRTLF